MGSTNQNGCVMSQSMEKVQLEGIEFGCTNLNTRFGAPLSSETLVELAVPAAQINGVDIRIAEIF